MMLQKQLPPTIPENLDELKLQNEAFLQELQNHLAGRSSGKSSSPISQAAALLGSPSPILPFLPYLQHHPYAPMPTDLSPSWNVPEAFADEAEASNKKSSGSGFVVDTPLNLSKPKSAEEAIKSSMKMMPNDGNNNLNKMHSVDHIASGSKMMPRLPYNIPFNNDESELFRLWPAMAAAAQHHHHNNSTSQSNNLPNMMASTRDLIGDNNFANFGQALAEASGKGKRGADQIGMNQSNASEDKVRMIRQQGRGRNAADRDLLAKQ